MNLSERDLLTVLKSHTIQIPDLDIAMYNILQQGNKESYDKNYVLLLNGLDKYILKISDRKDEKVSKELLQEAYVGIYGIGQLQSPNFANVFGVSVGTSCYDITPHNICDYIVYEYVEGNSLNQFLKKKPPVATIKKILLNIILAMHEANKKIGFFHGDLHTNNVIIKEDDTPVIIDYGFSSFGMSNQGNWDIDISTLIQSIKPLLHGYPIDFIHLINDLKKTLYSNSDDYDTFMQKAILLLS